MTREKRRKRQLNSIQKPSSGENGLQEVEVEVEVGVKVKVKVKKETKAHDSGYPSFATKQTNTQPPSGLTALSSRLSPQFCCRCVSYILALLFLLALNMSDVRLLALSRTRRYASLLFSFLVHLVVSRNHFH